MNTNQRAAAIARVRGALGIPGGKRTQPHGFFGKGSAPEIYERIKNRPRAERLVLMQQLVRTATATAVTVIRLADEAAVSAGIVELVRVKSPEWGERKSVAAWRHPLIDRLDLEKKLAGLGVPVVFSEPSPDSRSKSLFRQAVADAFIGITTADYALAETGTLVLKTRPGQARSVSLLPSIHVAVLPMERILRDLNELYTVLQRGPSDDADGINDGLTLISGPSKTGDIEFCLVHGAHGPRELYLYVVTG